MAARKEKGVWGEVLRGNASCDVLGFLSLVELLRRFGRRCGVSCFGLLARFRRAKSRDLKAITGAKGAFRDRE